MSDMLTEYNPNRPLRSLGSSQLEIPRIHTKQRECAFSYYAARSWNQLPEEIRCAKTLNPDSKLICLAVHLLNEHCATSQLTALYIIIFYSIIYIYTVYIIPCFYYYLMSILLYVKPFEFPLCMKCAI